ncbi:MAG: hypothetical protein ACRERC_12005, partial [Candidatus Binatia bacterium]
MALMRRASGVGLLAVLLGSAGSVQAEVTVELGTVAGRPGDRVTFGATVDTGGEQLGGVQVDVTISGAGLVPVGAGGSPDCRIGGGLPAGEADASFHFADWLCSGGDCSVLRAVVAALRSEIPDGSLLFTCSLDIAADAAPGEYGLSCDHTFASRPSGTDEAFLPATCIPGVVVVTNDLPPTPEPTSTRTAPPTATPRPGRPRTPQITATPTSTSTPCTAPCSVVHLGNAVGQPGDRVALDVWLESHEMEITGVQADIAFSPLTAIAADAGGRPDCEPNDDPNLGGYSGFAFLAASCGDDCAQFRALILPVQQVDIPDGTRLFTCALDIAADAPPGTYGLAISGTAGSDADGVAQLVSGA